MPSKRKRIGFLPRSEVQNIIDKICTLNKLSQSRVTGILVEEALSSRGVLNNSKNKFPLKIVSNGNNSQLISNENLNSEIYNVEDNLNLDNSAINDEIQMINDFIEFKFFKNIMNNNKKNS